MKTQRDTFWDEIYERAKTDRDIIVISADMGAPSLDKFRRDFPAQFINTGIAEQNSILVGAGLAKEGKKVFVYAIASFLTLNCIEKIRVQCSMMKIPLNIVGVGAGFSYPDSGPTHHLIEDIAMMRALPHIDTFNISSNKMAKDIVGKALNSDRTNYIRLERQSFGEIPHTNLDLNNGLIELIEGKDKLIISSGAMASRCFEMIKEESLTCGLVDLYRFPVDKELLGRIVSKYKNITVIEETFLPGGVGSAVLESLNDLEIQMPIKRIGLEIEKGFSYQYGGREKILDYYNLGRERVISHMRS